MASTLQSLAASIPAQALGVEGVNALAAKAAPLIAGLPSALQVPTTAALAALQANAAAVGTVSGEALTVAASYLALGDDASAQAAILGASTTSHATDSPS